MSRMQCWLTASCAMMAGGIAWAEVAITPSDLPSLSVHVQPGEVAWPDEARREIAAATLAFDPPEMRTFEVTAKVPYHNHAAWFEPWQPWPKKGKDGKTCTIELSPARDEEGIPILGGLYRSFDSDSLMVTSPDGAKAFRIDEDFKFNPDWGQVANLNGALGQPDVDDVMVSGRYALQRLDLVQVGSDGRVSVKKGESVLVCPELPAPDPGARALAGIYIAPWQVAHNPHFADGTAPRTATAYAVTRHEIFPVKPAPPVPPVNPNAVARTLTKLREGRPVRIALMGDSITLGAEAGPWWKNQFTDKDRAYRGLVIAGLRRRFPNAEITPIEAYKGGAGMPYALKVFAETVKPARPDLVVVAFGGNDAAGAVGKGPRNPPDAFQGQMVSLVHRAKEAGIEVVLVTTMQMNPWHPNGAAQRQPEYRQALLEVAEQEDVALADVYTEWMNLPTHGIPQFTQLHNWVNHPGPLGHRVYAEVILRLFPVNLPQEIAENAE